MEFLRTHRKWLPLILVMSFLLLLPVAFVGCGGGGGGGTPLPPVPPGPEPGVTVPTNVFLDSILPDDNYLFMHGSTNPDGSKMFVVVNEADAPQGNPSGVVDMYVLDGAELERAKVSLVDSGQVSGDHSGPWGATISFRSTWSVDGSMIALSAADRIFIINSTDLTPMNGTNGDTGIGGQTHDAMFTDDGKYAIMTLRTKPYGGADASKKDGEIQLYDVEAGAVVGASVSVCNDCHGSVLDSTLCGLDGLVEDQGDGTYTGTIYVAGHGGHIAKVPVTIDPLGGTPITVGTLDRVTVSMVKFADGAAGGKSQYKLHDVRIDYANDMLYWSTYNTDANGQVHYGRNVLSTGALDADVAVDVDVRATKPTMAMNTMPIYCASGQTADYFMPITMTNEAYITVIPKDKVTGTATPPPAGVISKATNVFLDSIVTDPNYLFFHGSTSHDSTKMLMAVNRANAPQGSPTGVADLYMLDAAELGKATVADVGITNTIITGDGSGPGGASITFRSNWSNDDSMVALAGADRIWLIDATDLTPVFAGGNKGIGGQIHDALFTTDDKYAVMAIRTNLPSPKDGELQLYDAVNDTVVGNPVSVCNACHPGTDATLCGVDGIIWAPGGGGGYGGSTVYTGTVFVAGHGGHVAKAEIEIDPSDTTTPITVTSLGRIVVSSSKFPAGAPGQYTSQYKLHDVRLEGTILGGTLYWSTYNTDANGQLHYGKIDLASSTLTADIAIDVDARALLPDRSVEDRNVMPMYCASGQTADYFMPITMTNEAYITVIPKSDIR